MRRSALRVKKPTACKCTHDAYVHRLKSGACYACECQSFEFGVNPVHRHMVAPAKPTNYNGTLYQSGAEAKYAQDLDWRLLAKDILGWKYHPLIHIYWNNVHLCDYELDFVVDLKDDWKEYVEVKGFIADTPVWRLKWKMAKAYFSAIPKTRLVLVPA